jgi:Mn-dependent DtxR family transcriptional regulator/Fe2+ transport system protein FeoA
LKNTREFDDATKESDLLKIVKEDALRILGEMKKKVSSKSLRRKIKVSPAFISEAIESLEKEDMISVENGFVELTKSGQDEAKDLIEKHLVLENYFKATRSEREAHRAAHLLEHYVSGQVIDNIKRMSTLKREGVPLIQFGLNREGLITDILFSDYKLFERMISMGILPGEVLEVTHMIPSGVVVRTSNKKIVLDKTIAKEIKVLAYEEI